MTSIFEELDSARTKILLIIAILVAADVAISLFGFGEPEGMELRTIATSTVVMATTAIAAGLGMLILYRQGLQGLHGKTYAALGMGLVLWTIGEALWVYDEVSMQGNFPSSTLADLFWISGYPFFAYHLFRNYLYFAKTIDKRLVAAVGVLTGIAVSYVTYAVMGASAMSSSEDLLTTIFRTSYAVGDFVIVFPAVLLVITLRKAKLHFSPWFFVSCALLITAVADLAFALVSIAALYDLEWIANLLYDTANFTMAGGLYWYYKYIVAFSINKKLPTTSLESTGKRSSDTEAQ